MFRTSDLYIIALNNVRNLNEKRHIVKVMMQDAKEYREAGLDNKADVLENLRSLVFGKLTTPRGKPAGVLIIAFYQHPYTARALG